MISAVHLFCIICALWLSLNLSYLPNLLHTNIFAVRLLSGAMQEDIPVGLDAVDCDGTDGGASTRWLAAEYARIQGKAQQANLLYRRLMICDQREELANFRLGQRIWFAGQYDAALAVWSPDIARKFVLTDCEYSLERADPEALLEICQIASSLVPDSEIAWEGIALAYEGLKKPELAIEAYEVALDLVAPSSRLRIVLALAPLYRQLGQHQQTIELLMPHIDENKVFVHFELGRAYFNLAQYGKAAANFERVLELADVPQPFHYVLLGETLIELEKYEEARLNLLRAIEIGDQDSYAVVRANDALDRLDSLTTKY